MRSVPAPYSAVRRRAIRCLIARWVADFSWRWRDHNDPDLLPGNRLCRPIDSVIDENCDNWISARHRMIGEKDDRLTTRWNLDRAANHTLAGQFLAHPRSVMLQRLTHEAHPDTVAAARGCPLGRHQRIRVGEPVVAWAAQRPQYESLAGQRCRRGLVDVGKVGRRWPDRNDVTSADAIESGLAGLRGVARTRFRL